MNSTEKKEVLIVILDEFADWEMSYITAFLNLSEKYVTKVVSINKEIVKSIGGLNVLPDYTTEEIPTNFYGLILIGGNSWRKPNSNKIIPVVEQAISLGVPLGAICDATVFMGRHGWLNHVKHTSNEVNDLKNYAKDNYQNEQNYVFEQAVTDNNIVTANGSATLEFAKELLILLEVYSKDQINQLYNFHKVGYYDAES
jgi:transcriptional regulator GlxA family with amidase domain